MVDIPKNGTLDTLEQLTEERLVMAIRQMESQVLRLSSPVRYQTLTSREINEAQIIEIAEFSRYIFANAWSEFAVCPPCDNSLEGGMRMSAKEVFKRDEEVSLLEIDSATLPNCPHCEQPMQLFQDRFRNIALMRWRLTRPDSYTSIITNQSSGRVEGICYGYGCKLGEQFLSEWRNEYNYMSVRQPQYDRDPEKLLLALREVFPEVGFKLDQNVFCWNAVAISQKVRGQGYLPGLINEFLSTIKQRNPDLFNQYTIGEVIENSPFHKIVAKGGVKAVPGFLRPPETLTCVIFNQLASTLVNRFK